MTELPRLLIEDWLPAAAIGVECKREHTLGGNSFPPNTRLHVWWARRPLTVSRAAVLGSLLPADFPRDVFERTLGFGRPGHELVDARRLLDSKSEGTRLAIGFDCDRAFRHVLREDDLSRAHEASEALWGSAIQVLDPMAGGGSIPLESVRLGFRTLGNEYNPVACTVLEATVDYPFRHGERLAAASRKWAQVLNERVGKRLGRFYPVQGFLPPRNYIFARTVPCPDTQRPTPLVSDWHLLKLRSGTPLVAEPVVNEARGIWTVRVREVGGGAGQVRELPRPTYVGGKGISLWTGRPIDDDYIKAKAQAGQMGIALYAVAYKTPQGLEFRPPEPIELKALVDAEQELARLRPGWERAGVLPTEEIPAGDQPGGRLAIGGIRAWADVFTPRQLLCLGVLTDELQRLRPEILKSEGQELSEAIVHLLSLVLDKFGNHNAILASWDCTTGGIRSVFDRHGYAFKATPAEMPPCHGSSGFAWAIDNVLGAYEELSRLPRAARGRPAEVTLGSATSMPQLADGSVTAVVVDPPYADNVQYAELANFFYVWLKRTMGPQRPEWFSTYLCDTTEEAVVNVSRHRANGTTPTRRGRRDGSAPTAKRDGQRFYQQKMGEVFRECHRVLRPDGALTVMFTHKKQDAWESLFQSLIEAGFTITATWPVKTESEYSLHQARKNAAQSTVILVARKRPPGASMGLFNQDMEDAIRQRARDTAERLRSEGLNAVDQLVGSFGPAMEVYSRYDGVRTDTGVPVGVAAAIDLAAGAVSDWRVEQLAARGLDGVEPEGRFALLCWDVLGAAEFRFNEAKLLGNAVNMDVDQLVAAGLVRKTGEKIEMLAAQERRRDRALEPEAAATMRSLAAPRGRQRKSDVLKVHPLDPSFRTALDGCHALALRYIEAGGAAGGIGAARALARQQGWNADGPVAHLMDALVQAAPEALHQPGPPKSPAAKFPEFRAWHALLHPLFGLTPPDWTVRPPLQPALTGLVPAEDEESEEEDEA